MKENPQEKKIHNNLKPGVLSIEGFLGKDKRNYSEIIETDSAALAKLGYTSTQIAERMQMFTDTAFESFDSSIIIEDIYEVSYDTFRGKLLCPFAHSGTFRKGVIKLTNLTKNLSITWTPLNIHMIGEHSFFEGKDSVHRLEPEKLVEILF